LELIYGRLINPVNFTANAFKARLPSSPVKAKERGRSTTKTTTAIGVAKTAISDGCGYDSNGKRSSQHTIIIGVDPVGVKLRSHAPPGGVT
jgi:hypothetical protein